MPQLESVAAPKLRNSRRPSRLSSARHAREFRRWLFATPPRWLDQTLGFLVACAVFAALLSGAYRAPFDPDLLATSALITLALWLVLRLGQRLGLGAPGRGANIDLELGTLAIAAVYVLIEASGGPSGSVYPLVYVVLAFVAAYQPVLRVAFFVLLTLGIEAGVLGAALFTDAGIEQFAAHGAFVVMFTWLFAVLLRADIAHRRWSAHRSIRAELQRIDDEAREFRLTSGLGIESRELSEADIRNRRQVGSVRAIRDSLYNALAVAEKALRPHTVALLWLDADERSYHVRELRSHSDHVIEDKIAVGEGFIGAVTKRREALALTRLTRNHGGLTYYRRHEPVTDFAAVPIMEGRSLRGILVADRTTGEAFAEDDLGVMHAIVSEIVRVVQVERIFVDMDREKFRKEHFYQASRDFNSALTVDEVAQVALDAARRVTRADVAAVAVATERENVMRITAAHGDASWVGREFSAESTLVGQAIRARIPLPHGTKRNSAHTVFGTETPVSSASIKVLPLLWKDHGVGALVLGSDQDSFLGDDTLDMLRVVTDHAAIAIANAQMYARMERMATTDGLTGLTNHRQFQIAFDEMLARSERYGRKLSVVLTDIDHFKSVNDTYGHPVGDRVLKRVARILEENARKTDIVARYGGEEFAILMEETDTEGAFQIAERIREAAQAESFSSEHGRFSCTLSLGVSTYPDDGRSKSEVIERADQNLYQAKHGGRNRTVVSPKRRTRAAS